MTLKGAKACTQQLQHIAQNCACVQHAREGHVHWDAIKLLTCCELGCDELICWCDCFTVCNEGPDGLHTADHMSLGYRHCCCLQVLVPCTVQQHSAMQRASNR